MFIYDWWILSIWITTNFTNGENYPSHLQGTDPLENHFRFSLIYIFNYNKVNKLYLKHLLLTNFIFYHTKLVKPICDQHFPWRKGQNHRLIVRNSLHPGSWYTRRSSASFVTVSSYSYFIVEFYVYCILIQTWIPRRSRSLTSAGATATHYADPPHPVECWSSGHVL